VSVTITTTTYSHTSRPPVQLQDMTSSRKSLRRKVCTDNPHWSRIM